MVVASRMRNGCEGGRGSTIHIKILELCIFSANNVVMITYFTFFLEFINLLSYIIRRM